MEWGVKCVGAAPDCLMPLLNTGEKDSHGDGKANIRQSDKSLDLRNIIILPNYRAYDMILEQNTERTKDDDMKLLIVNFSL